MEHLNAQNRLKVITALLFIYNQQLSQIQKPTLYHLCRIASQLVNQGFAKFERPHRSYGSANDFHNPAVDAIPSSKALPRIPVSAELLLELTHAAYFVMFNEFASVAIRTIKDIHRRACFEMMPSVILVTNAVKNSLQANPSGEKRLSLHLIISNFNNIFICRPTERWPNGHQRGIDSSNDDDCDRVQVYDHKCFLSSQEASRCDPNEIFWSLSLLISPITLLDDIPIQLSKDGVGSNANQGGGMNSSMGLDTSNQLQSINEDCEAMDCQQLPTGAHLGRNTPGRQSKEFTAKLHKVSFPNFKKLKDKDKDSKGKSSPSAAAGGSMTMIELNSSNKQQESPPSAPLKRASILKDKLINRNSSVPSEPLENSEKISVKLKNISLDSGTSTAGATVLGGSSSANSNNSFDLTESCSDPLENSIATRPSILPLEYSAHNNGAPAGNITNNNGNSNVQVYQM